MGLMPFNCSAAGCLGSVLPGIFKGRGIRKATPGSWRWEVGDWSSLCGRATSGDRSGQTKRSFRSPCPKFQDGYRMRSSIDTSG